MALISKEKRPCAIMVKASIDDGEGGQVTSYMQSRKFYAVVTPENTVAINHKKILGGAEVSAKRYKFFYPSQFKIKLNDILRTLDDGMTYKVTASETEPAKSASIQYSLVSAEEWEMPE